MAIHRLRLACFGLPEGPKPSAFVCPTTDAKKWDGTDMSADLSAEASAKAEALAKAEAVPPFLWARFCYRCGPLSVLSGGMLCRFIIQLGCWTGLLIPTLVSTCIAEQILEGYSVVRGKEFAFEIKAPRGWVLDNEGAKQQGLNLVFYPTGADWQTSKAVIYVRVRSFDARVRNIDGQIEDTLRNLRADGSQSVSVKYVKTLTTQDASKAKIYYYS